jgi:molybdate transport system ATP-binding protein
MSFDVTVSLRRGDRLIEASFSSHGGATVLVGRSGVGKTSVLMALAGLLRPERGRVVVAGRTLFDAEAGLDIAPEHRRAGMVFQDARLFPHLRVAANLDYGRRAGADREGIVAMLGIGHLLDRWPRTLSGGEARRVAIGRALASQPDYLLLDEPLSSLDPERVEEVTVAIERIRDTQRLPILMVTHDREEAARIGTQVVRM